MPDSNNAIDDGGAAFPRAPGSGGMKLRDWFAGQALGHIPKMLDVQGKNMTAAMIAEWAYEVADAMLAARK